ncbi:hypothetical protein SBOR_9817 [Sclerotinia borealis F-4128]|uniref:Uncharacterized protein n=1 Tax=Sclerotinia borealis (strain F-4128) TaxID=1432307 RepID=W9C286_SCLBF|nr:hypothetical protein SBOR_9817 [Sclerotinia borealis F-4128]
MGNKNRRVPQAAAIELIPKEPSEIANHPGMVLTGNILTITIDYCNVNTEQENSQFMTTLLAILPNYAPYTKIIQLSIHADISHNQNHNIHITHVQDMKSIVNELNKFGKLVQVRVRTLLDYHNFSQMKLAAAMYGLNKG